MHHIFVSERLIKKESMSMTDYSSYQLSFVIDCSSGGSLRLVLVAGVSVQAVFDSAPSFFTPLKPVVVLDSWSLGFFSLFVFNSVSTASVLVKCCCCCDGICSPDIAAVVFLFSVNFSIPVFSLGITGDAHSVRDNISSPVLNVEDESLVGALKFSVVIFDVVAIVKAGSTASFWLLEPFNDPDVAFMSIGIFGTTAVGLTNVVDVMCVEMMGGDLGNSGDFASKFL